MPSTDNNEPTADVLQQWITDIVSGIATEKQREEWFSLSRGEIQVLCKYKDKKHMLIKIFPVSGEDTYDMDMKQIPGKTDAYVEIWEKGSLPQKYSFNQKQQLRIFIDTYLTLKDGEFQPEWVSCEAIRAWIRSMYNLTDDAFNDLFDEIWHRLTFIPHNDTWEKIEIIQGDGAKQRTKISFKAPNGQMKYHDIGSKKDLEAVVNDYPILGQYLLTQQATDAQWRAVDQLTTILGHLCKNNFLASGDSIHL
jgi:hypothetical protein